MIKNHDQVLIVFIIMLMKSQFLEISSLPEI